MRWSGVSIDLSFRSVATQVLSAYHSLTSVFGMGTGGPCESKTLTAVVHIHREPNKVLQLSYATDELTQTLGRFKPSVY